VQSAAALLQQAKNKKAEITSGEILPDKPTGEVPPSYPLAEANNGDPSIIPVIETNRTNEPTTGLNLSGSFEKWGVSSTQVIKSAKIEFNNLTAQQIKQILQRIPSTFKAMFEISYKKGSEE
jgi:hypothetical protein